jgi:hypothetical protein
MKELKGKIIKFELVSNNDIEDQDITERVIVTDVKLSADAPARMKTLRADGKKWYMTVVYSPNTEKPYALFCTTNHREKTAPISDAVDRLILLAERKGILDEHINKLKAKIEGDNNINKLTRATSLLLRHNVSIINIVGTLDKMEDIYLGSFLFQVKKFLSAYIKNGEKVEESTCDECGSTNIIYSEGCLQCVDCGSGKCG